MTQDGTFQVRPAWQGEPGLYVSFDESILPPSGVWDCDVRTVPAGSVLNDMALAAAGKVEGGLTLAGASSSQDGPVSHSGCGCSLCQAAVVASQGGGTTTTAGVANVTRAPHSGCGCSLCQGALALANGPGPQVLYDGGGGGGGEGGGGGGITLFDSGTQLRSYRIAIAATGEFTASNGGTVASGLAAVTSILNQVNLVYENTLAIRLVLIANNNTIIYTNSATDPYTGTSVGTMLDENRANLNSVIGTANYDIGHVLTTAAGGGVAYLAVVGNDSFKGGGASGSQGMGPDPFYYRVAHEIGHHFGANHTFNYSRTQRSATSAYEYGYGTTILSYGHLNTGRHANLHHQTQVEILNYADVTIPLIGTRTPTGNTLPVVNVGADYAIPAGTPFVLTATGSDADGDSLTYSWEQRDLGPVQAPPGAVDNGSSPRFRVRPPTSDASRTFPLLSDLAAGTVADDERLFTVARTSTFRVTARDNRAGGGGTKWDDMVLTIVNTGASFAVTAPNTAVSWVGGSTQTITWDVAGTTAAPINTANVHIKLSTDGGLTYPHTLASGTPNDGSQTITVPNLSTSQARIRVEASGSVFFDISNVIFSITAVASVTNVTSTTANGTYGTGTLIPIIITFSGPVTVTGAPTLALNAGLGASATYSSGSPGTSLTFHYTVAAGQSSPDLDHTATTALALAGGSILDGNGNPAILTLANPGAAGSLGVNKDIVISTTPPVLATVTSTTVSWGSQTSTALVTQGDGLRLLPAGRSNTIPWLGINKLGITLSSSSVLAAGDVSVMGTTVANYGPVTIMGGGTSYMILLAQPINVGDRVTVIVGNPSITSYARRLDVMPGDVNDDTFVNSTDAAIARAAALGQSVPVPLVFIDINGDGVVDMTDFNLVRARSVRRL